MLHPLPSPPFRHSKSQAAITSPLQTRNPTLLRPPRHRCPAGASSPTMSSTATARRPSSTSPDVDLSSISPSCRFSRPVLHLQGAAPTFASSIAPPQSPQRRLDLPHRNRSTLTNSSDEAEANSAPPRRFCTHRCILSFIRSHGAAGARYRADMACLHRRRRRRPHHPRRLSPCRCFLGGDFHNSTS